MNIQNLLQFAKRFALLVFVAATSAGVTSCRSGGMIYQPDLGVAANAVLNGGPLLVIQNRTQPVMVSQPQIAVQSYPGYYGNNSGYNQFGYGQRNVGPRVGYMPVETRRSYSGHVYRVGGTPPRITDIDPTRPVFYNYYPGHQDGY